MTKFTILAETGDTVTLKRGDFEALLAAAEDAIDLKAVRAHRSHEEHAGWTAARRGYLTRREAERLLAGESPLRVWREKRGLSQRALATAAAASPSYLAEVETGRKPGSAKLLIRIAAVLEAPVEEIARPLGQPHSPRGSSR